MKAGTVYLVGSGPGAADLITVRGQLLLARADVVVHDRLIDPRLLDNLKEGAELVDVGKSSDRHLKSQDEINEILVKLAESGRTVVRLKGGDPYILGRGGEEGSFLKAAGIPFEVVPGVTAAAAVGVSAGIPLTDRRHTSGVTLITGHEVLPAGESRLDWGALARAGNTIVIYMGVKNLPVIVERLIEGGLDPSTPVAVVERGATPRQRVVTGTVSEIAEKAVASGIKPPALTIIGGVVDLREDLTWFESRPLFGKVVLVTRSRRQASKLVTMLEDEGALCIEGHTIDIRPPESQDKMDAAVHSFDSFNWVVFTSPNGVNTLFDRLRETGTDVRRLAGPRIAAIGPATARALEERGLAVDLLPAEYTSVGLMAAMEADLGDITGEKFLLLQADIAPPYLEDRLAGAGAEVTRVTAYRNVRPEDLPPEVEEAVESGTIDWITFTSASTASGLKELLGDEKLNRLLKKARTVSMGPATSEQMRELGIPVSVEAGQATLRALVDAIIEKERETG